MGRTTQEIQSATLAKNSNVALGKYGGVLCVGGTGATVGVFSAVQFIEGGSPVTFVAEGYSNLDLPTYPPGLVFVGAVTEVELLAGEHAILYK